MEAVKRLKTRNIKPSLQRMAILNYLMSRHTHPTADEIYTALFPSMPTLSKTTVYNTLRLFAEHGAVQMLTIDEKNACFDADVTPHAHFLCKKCGKIYDLNVAGPTPTPEAALADGHQITESHYYHKGICKECLLK